MPYHPQVPVPPPLVTKQSHTITTWIPALDGFRECITTGLSLLCKVLFNFLFTLFNSPFTFHLPCYRFSCSHPPCFPFFKCSSFPHDGFLAFPLSHTGILGGGTNLFAFKWYILASDTVFYLNRLQAPCRLLTFWADLFMVWGIFKLLDSFLGILIS